MSISSRSRHQSVYQSNESSIGTDPVNSASIAAAISRSQRSSSSCNLTGVLRILLLPHRKGKLSQISSKSSGTDLCSLDLLQHVGPPCLSLQRALSPPTRSIRFR